MPLATQVVQGNAHQVHGAHGMMKAGMQRARVNKVCKAKLLDPAETLKIGVFNDVKNQFTGDCDKAVNGIIKNFFLIHAGMFYLGLIK